MSVKGWFVTVGLTVAFGFSGNVFAGCCYKTNGQPYCEASDSSNCRNGGTYSSATCCALSPTVTICRQQAATVCSLTPDRPRSLASVDGIIDSAADGSDRWLADALAAGNSR